MIDVDVEKKRTPGVVIFGAIAAVIVLVYQLFLKPPAPPPPEKPEAAATPAPSATPVSAKPPEDLELVNVKGDCQGVRARFLSPSEQEFYGFENLLPCDPAASGGPEDLFARLKAQARAGSPGRLQKLPQEDEELNLTLKELSGDCRIAQFEFEDHFVGNTIKHGLAGGCELFDLTQPDPLPLKVMTHIVKPPAGAEKPDPLTGLSEIPRALLRCDDWLTPDNLSATMESVQSRTDMEKWRVLCFREGEFQGPVVLKGQKRLILMSPDGEPVRLDSNTMAPLEGDEPSAALEIMDSRDILIDGISFKNHHVAFEATKELLAEDPELAKVSTVSSRALSISGSRGIFLRNSLIESHGTQTLTVRQSEPVRFTNVQVRGAFRPVELIGSNVFAEGFSVFQEHEGPDERSLIWVDRAGAVMKKVDLVPMTGRSLLSGGADAQKNAFFLKDVTSLQLDSWIQAHSNYPGLQLILEGYYPKRVRDFWQNPHAGAGQGEGSSVIRL